MERKLKLHVINFLNALAIFVLSVYFAFFKHPIWIQISPAVLVAVPLVIAWYERRMEKERIERQKIVDKAQKLRPLLVKLERLRVISIIGSSLTYHPEWFVDNEVASLGWRRYFDKHGKTINEKFDDLRLGMKQFINKTDKQEEQEFSRILDSFRLLVSGFCHLYDDLREMIQLVGKNPPKEVLKDVQELQTNYMDFLQALRNLCDEEKEEEIGKIFSGRYPLTKK